MVVNQLAIKSYTPQILTGVSVFGAFGGAFLAAKAARKIEREFPDEDLGLVEYIKAHWKAYIPAASVCLGTAACAVASNRISTAQIATMAAGAALLARNFDKYKDATKRIVGEENFNKISKFIADEACKKEDVIAEQTGNGDILFFDEFSGRFFQSTKEDVYAAILELNRQFAMDKWVSLNAFYGFLGIDTVEIGDDLGWSKQAGQELDYEFIDFEFELTNLRPNASAPEDVDGYIIRYPVCPCYNYKPKSRKKAAVR